MCAAWLRGDFGLQVTANDDLFPIDNADFQIVDINGVKVAGYSNLPARLPADTSSLYAKNLLAFLPLITAEDGSLNLETDDEIVTAMILTKGGETVNERLKS